MAENTQDATIDPNECCSECGGKVVQLLCNNIPKDHEMNSFDYWAYCSNKCCKHHGGEGYYSGQDSPSFIKQTSVDE